MKQKIDEITEELSHNYSDRLYKLRIDNALVITGFILSLKIEINLSAHHIMNNIMALTLLSQFHNNKKSFRETTRDDILSYLNILRRSESTDPLHKWIGIYNLHKIYFSPPCRNIPNLKRKEQSIYKPSDLWTEEDDLLFLKYCPSATSAII